jgi:hypothetical protein
MKDVLKAALVTWLVVVGPSVAQTETGAATDTAPGAEAFLSAAEFAAAVAASDNEVDIDKLAGKGAASIDWSAFPATFVSRYKQAGKTYFVRPPSSVPRRS